MQRTPNSTAPFKVITDPAPQQIENKHPLTQRWMHWVNFPLMLILLWSGILLYVDNSDFRIGIGSWTLVQLFPKSFYQTFGMLAPNHNDVGLAWHLTFMWVFTVNTVAYVLFNAISGQWRYLVPRKLTWGKAVTVIRHDVFRSGRMPTQYKYNGAQKLVYFFVFIMLVLMTTTGLAIWKPGDLGWLAIPTGGVDLAKPVHFWLTMAFSLYIVVHVVQVARAGWNGFRSMVTGKEIVAVKDPQTVQAVAAAEGEPVLPRSEPLPAVEAQAIVQRQSRKSFTAAAIAAGVLLLGWGVWNAQSGALGYPPSLKGMLDAYKSGDPGEAGAATGEPDAAPKAGETGKTDAAPKAGETDRATSKPPPTGGK